MPTAGTLTCPPPELPTLPFDVLPEILCRLPVKLLVQLRCLCKFFNSLISDPKFAKKHLRMSTKHHHLMVISSNSSREWVHYDSPIPLLLSSSTVVTQTQLYPPDSLKNRQNYVNVLCSCDGMFCGKLNVGSYFLWNPSIKTFKFLPPLENPDGGGQPFPFSISFGYDNFIDNYKVIAVSEINEVSVYTLGTDSWRRIEDIPYSCCIDELNVGVFVSGTVNWFIIDHDSNIHFILSLDLKKESYQKLLLPDYENNSPILDVVWDWILDVVRDCLCLFSTLFSMFVDVWIMNEYGNQETWTKLYTIPNMHDQGFKAFTSLYISEDDQLLAWVIQVRSGTMKLVVYDSKTGTLNIPEFQNNYRQICPNVYIESLISP